MKFRPIHKLLTAAVVAALAAPSFAAPPQDSPVERRLRPGGAAARDVSGGDSETRTDDVVRPNPTGNTQPGTVQPGNTGVVGQPRTTVGGVIVEGDRVRNAEERTIRDGQNRAEQYDSEQAGRAGQQGRQGQLGNAAIARWVAADNEAEIRVAEVAQRQSNNDQVKQFAAMLVKDHTQFGEKVRNAAQSDHNAGNRESGNRNAADLPDNTANRNANRNQDATRDRDADRDNNTANRNTVLDRTNADRDGRQADGHAMRNQSGNNAGVAMHEQIKEKCAESAVKMLKQKQGREFDAAFVGSQIVAHQAMIDTLQVAQMQANGDLRNVLQQGEQATKQHLELAKELMNQLEQERN